jgi:hypothetical protein
MTIVPLTGGKLTVIYFLHLLYAIYYSITMHRRQRKKVSILPRGDVNPGPVPLRRGLLEYNPNCTVGATYLSCDWLRPHT